MDASLRNEGSISPIVSVRSRLPCTRFGISSEEEGGVSSAAIQDDVSSWLCGYFVSVKEFCTAPHKNPILGQAPSITDATLLADVGGEKGMTVAKCIAVFAFLWTDCETGVLKNGGREGGLGGTRPLMLSRR